MECYYSLVLVEGCFRKKLNVFFYVVEVEIMIIIKFFFLEFFNCRMMSCVLIDF